MKWTEKFLTYLAVEKQASPHTIRKAGGEIHRWAEAIDPLTATRDDAHAYLAKMAGRGLQQSSIAVNWAYIRSFYNFLHQVGAPITGNAWTVRVEDKTQSLPRLLPADKIAAILSAPNTRRPMGRRNRAILDLLLSCGIRASELVTAKVDGVDFERGEIRVFGKGRKERVVPLDERANPYLRRWIETDRPSFTAGNNGPLFVKLDGTSLSTRGLRSLVHECGKVAGLMGDVSPHRFRHTMATNLLNNQLGLRHLQEILGHANIATTQIYTHVTSDDVKAEYLGAMGRLRSKNQPEKPWASLTKRKHDLHKNSTQA